MTERATNEQIEAARRWARGDRPVSPHDLGDALDWLEGERSRADQANRDRIALRRNLMAAQQHVAALESAESEGWRAWHDRALRAERGRRYSERKALDYQGDYTKAVAEISRLKELVGVLWKSRRHWQVRHSVAVALAQWHDARAQGAEQWVASLEAHREVEYAEATALQQQTTARIEAVRKLTYASDDGAEWRHNDRCEGEPTCPACWARDIRRALNGEEA